MRCSELGKHNAILPARLSLCCMSMLIGAVACSSTVFDEKTTFCRVRQSSENEAAEHYCMPFEYQLQDERLSILISCRPQTCSLGGLHHATVQQQQHRLLSVFYCAFQCSDDTIQHRDADSIATAMIAEFMGRAWDTRKFCTAGMQRIWQA